MHQQGRELGGTKFANAYEFVCDLRGRLDLQHRRVIVSASIGL